MMQSLSERLLAGFPQPYKSASSPYNKFVFDSEVRDFCGQELLTQRVHLRVSKCVVVGDIAVGKSCLINRFGYNVFTNNYKATIGVDFDVQKFNILGLPFNLQVWDTAGQERFQCIAATYYRGAHVAVIVFDMSNLASLSSAKKWLQDVLNSNQHSMPLIFLVGNKKDLLCESAYHFVEGEAMKVAKELSAEYWSVSAQSGEAVEELFNRIAVLTFHEMMWREIDASQKEKLSAEATISYSEFVKLRKEPITRKNCVALPCYGK